MIQCAAIAFFERNFAKRLAKMSALSAFTPPPPLNICSKSCLNRVQGLPGLRRVFDAPNGHNSVRYY